VGRPVRGHPLSGFEITSIQQSAISIQHFS
jgi:hypothetical protein